MCKNIATVWPSLKLGFLIATALPGFLAPNSGSAAPPHSNPRVIPPVAAPHGHSYGEWGRFGGGGL